jgi:hypothetical protein
MARGEEGKSRDNLSASTASLRAKNFPPINMAQIFFLVFDFVAIFSEEKTFHSNC